MLFGITKRCQGKCSHCISDATCDGEHMTIENVKKTLRLIKEIEPLVVLVTGGEPTEHPEFFKIINMLLQIFPKERVLLISNGMFLYNDDFTQKVLDLGIGIQVTNDKRYYPFTINIDVKHPSIMYINEILSIYPMGRALKNNITPYNTIGTKCFNLRSVAIGNANSLKEAIHILETRGKFCTPSIHADGNMYVGETWLCGSIGDVNMSQKQLYDNLLNFKCNKCKMASPALESVIEQIKINRKQKSV